MFFERRLPIFITLLLSVTIFSLFSYIVNWRYVSVSHVESNNFQKFYTKLKKGPNDVEDGENRKNRNTDSAPDQ